MFNAQIGEHLKTCPVCRKQFRAQRRDKVTCSDKCRKRLNRIPSKRDRVKEAYAEAQSSIRLMTIWADDYEVRHQVGKLVKSLIIELVPYVLETDIDQLTKDLREYAIGQSRDSGLSHFRPGDDVS